MAGTWTPAVRQENPQTAQVSFETGTFAIFYCLTTPCALRVLCARINVSGCSAVASALRSGRRGRWFESTHPDQFLLLLTLLMLGI